MPIPHLPVPLVAFAFAALLAVASPLVAEEVEQLTLADDPFETTDPHATDPGQAELAFVTIYERARQGSFRSRMSLDGEIQVGALPGLDIRFGQRSIYGNVESRGSVAARGIDDGMGVPRWAGATRLGALYQFTDGEGVLPIISTVGRIRSTYSGDTPAYEGDFALLLGKTIGSGARAFGINLNLGWTSRLNPSLGERPNRYSLDVAMGRGISPNAVVALAYARRQQERGERDLNIVEAGIRYRLGSNGPVIGVALGAGMNRDSPLFQVNIGAQWAFDLWR